MFHLDSQRCSVQRVDSIFEAGIVLSDKLDDITAVVLDLRVGENEEAMLRLAHGCHVLLVRLRTKQVEIGEHLPFLQFLHVLTLSKSLRTILSDDCSRHTTYEKSATTFSVSPALWFSSSTNPKVRHVSIVGGFFWYSPSQRRGASGSGAPS